MKCCIIPLPLAVAALCWCVDRVTAQGTYDERPLRGNLIELPFANTGLGREGKRFADREVNRYRLYDFYRRQAVWHVENPEERAERLLPFPGLDGGRRGHWGVTNETSIQAMPRNEEPQYASPLARGEHGLHSLSYPETPGVMVYDTRRPGVRSVIPKGRLSSSAGAFRAKVDVWGFSIAHTGEPWITGGGGDWTRGDQNGVYLGHYQHAHRAVYHVALGDARLLEMPELVDNEGIRVLARSVAIIDDASGTRWALPNGAFTHHAAEQGHLFSQGDVRLLAWSEAGAEIAPSEDGAALVLRQAPAGSRVYMAAWQAGADDAGFMASLRREVFPNPADLTHGGPSRFPGTLTLKGTMNADPAASGTAYEIDDIPIPFENPWRVPMTLSGIAFDTNGTAFVCTMVGDVWKVSGLDDRLEKVTWKRFASGLNMPMGIVVVDGVPYVSCRKQVIKLHDLNGNEEADYYEQWNRVEIPLGALNGGDIMRDASGNFYINGGRGIVRMSPDGREVSWVGRGARNPFGLGVRGDGLVLSDSSEGESGNGTCTIYESDHPENAASRAKLKRILYLPRGVDASPGSRLFLDDPRFGPLGKAIVGLSYGSGSWYAMLRDPGEGTPQAAMLPMPGTFWSGACRLAQHPGDGQVFVVGLDGWGDYAVAEGCFHRIRYTGTPALTPTAWQAHRNGLMLHFNEPVDAAQLDPARFFAQQWNVVDYRVTYGSAEYSVKDPAAPGHDRLVISRVLPQLGGRSVFFEIPTLRPAASTHLYGRLASTTGATIELDLYATLNALRDDFTGAHPSDPEKPSVLILPEAEGNGNTYQVITDFYDTITGRALVKREVTDEVPWDKSTLNFAWIQEHILTKHCVLCHQPGMPHDLTTYEKLVERIRPGMPEKSHALGLVKTGSMPPFGLPALHPRSIAALEEWIRLGAPR